MCHEVYIASDVPLPLVARDVASPSFYVAELDDSQHEVRAQLAKEYVYYLGSHQGCSCGLVGEPYPGEDPVEAERCAADRAALAAYVLRNLPFLRRLRLYSCWAGDEHLPPLAQEEATFGSEQPPAIEFGDRLVIDLKWGR